MSKFIHSHAKTEKRNYFVDVHLTRSSYRNILNNRRMPFSINLDHNNHSMFTSDWISEITDGMVIQQRNLTTFANSLTTIFRLSRF